MATRCVIYTRVSGKSQEDRQSLDTQLTECKRYAAREGWIIVDEVMDVMSGLNSITRVGYNRLMELARTGATDVILCWRLDRFGRDNADAIKRANELDTLDIRLVSATQGTLDPGTRDFIFTIAKIESRATSERTFPNLKARAEMGLWNSKPPTGYQMDPTRGPGRLVPKEPEASAIREAFERVAGGESGYNVTAWLNARPDILPRGGGWFTQEAVNVILKNPVYAGLVSWNKVRNSKLNVNQDGKRVRKAKPASEHMLVPGQHTPLVSLEVFDAVQAVYSSHASHRRPDRSKGLHLLTGVLRCGTCGRGMYGQWNNYTRLKAQGKTPGPGHGFIYKCSNKGHPFVNGHKTDSYVLDKLAWLEHWEDEVESKEKIPASLWQRVAARVPSKVEALEKDKARQVKRRAVLTMQLADGILQPQDYKVAIDVIETKLAAVEAELTALRPTALDIGKARQAATQWLTTAAELSDVEAAPHETAALNGWIAGAIRRVVINSKAEEPVFEWQPWAETLVEELGAAQERGESLI